MEENLIIQCRKCGYKFMSWKPLMVTLPQNDMKPLAYCLERKNYDNLEKFKHN